MLQWVYITNVNYRRLAYIVDTLPTNLLESIPTYAEKFNLYLIEAFQF